MSTAELAVIDVAGTELVRQMEAALESLSGADIKDASDVRKRAAAVQAAAHQTEANEIEVAAARLRLHAERRLGEIGSREMEELGYSGSQIRDFTRLSKIPRRWQTTKPNAVFERGSVVDLFVEAVEESLAGRSHTPYAVYRRSLMLSEERFSAKHRWLCTTWDGSWAFWYTDPTTKRGRHQTFEGSLEEVLEARAQAMGIAKKADKVELLPVRYARTPLDRMLVQVRSARDAVTQGWSTLTPTQREELDGAYSKLDDLALAITRAMNL